MLDSKRRDVHGALWNLRGKKGRCRVLGDQNGIGSLEFPYVETIKGMLLFVVANEMVKEEYTYENKLGIFDKLAPVLAQRSVAYETGVFNPIPNGLCRRWCQATRCIHNGNYKEG